MYKDKPDGGDSLDSNHNKDDVKETITVKKATPAPKADTPSTPLADTGAMLGQHIWGLVLAGLALVAGGITFFMKKRKSSSEK
ncbi:LPXTG cell wall anchor domain-containing protein [Lactococcus garvieae]